MKDIRKQLVSWKNEFEAAKFTNVLNEYQNCLTEQRWSLNDEVYAASYCLIALNVEVHKVSKPNVDAPQAPVIFTLAKLFCESAAKSWELVSVDFPAAVFYIFKFLLDRDHVAESLYIATRAFEYQTKHPASENAKNQPNVLYSMLIHLFGFTEKLPLTEENRSKVSDLVTFLSTNFTVGSRSKLPTFLKYFSSFLLKCSKTNDDYVDECCNLLKNLARSVCHVEAEAESTFMEIIRTLVSEICELSLNKQSKQLLLHCIDTFEESCGTSSTCISFCRNIFRIAVCSPEDCLSDVVVRANYELQMLIAEESPVLKSAVYFSTVVILKMRNWDSVECPFKKNCALQLFELLYTLAEQLYEINLNEFCQKAETPRKDICSCVYLCSFLLHFAEKITDLNLCAPFACDFILKSVEFFRKCIKNVRYLEQRKRHNMLCFIGASCVNIYHKLAEFELQRKYIELCTIIGPALVTLDAEDLTIPNFQVCLKKIIVNLCVSYRTTNSHVEPLIASIVWSIMLPNHSSTFMDIFGNLKQKLYASKNKTEQSFHLLTSLDLLKHEKNTWQHDCLNQVNAVDLLRKELEQYKKFNIRSVKLMQNIIEAVRKLKPTVYQKSLLYMMIGEILTNSDSTENVEFLKKFVKSVDVLVNCLSKCADSPLETEVTTLHALLGDLLYVKFRMELLIHRSENEGELKSLSSFKKPAAAEPGMEPDFKEEGNITLTNYVCLSAQRKLTRVLDSAVENWQRGLHNKSKLDLSHLKDAALIYRLYCNTAKEIETWELLYSAAILIDDFTMAVYAYANLLTKPWALEPEWKNNVENDLLPKASEDIRLFYQLNYLHRRLIDGFDKQDEKMLLSLPQDALVKHNLFANYCFLVSLCQQRNVVAFSKNQQLMSFLAYSNLMCRTKSRKWNSLGECCELQCLLFDVVLLLVTSNVQVYQVAEAKSYLKDPINLILKLSLPFRICQYLNISVRIDALTCTMDECYLKLQDICDILELKRDKQALLCKPSVMAPVLSPVMDSDFRADGGGRRVELPSLSHVAPQWKFQLPDFMNHEQRCDCDLCTSHEYGRLLCEVTALFGVYYRLADRGTDAVEFFEGAIRMHDIIKERYSSVCRSLIVELLKIKIFVLFEYANYRLMTGDFDAASALNALSFQHSRDNGLPVQQYCVEQRWTIRKALVVEKEKETKRDVDKTAARSERARASRAVAPPKSAVVPKTPAGRKLVSATPSRLPQPLVFVDEDADDDGRPARRVTAPAAITPYPRQSRRALFGEFASPVKLPPKARREQKTARAGTPPDIVMQTPSALEKRSRRLGERKNLFEKQPLRPANPAPAAASPSKVTRRKPISRREKENAVARK